MIVPNMSKDRREKSVWLGPLFSSLFDFHYKSASAYYAFFFFMRIFSESLELFRSSCVLYALISI